MSEAGARRAERRWQTLFVVIAVACVVAIVACFAVILASTLDAGYPVVFGKGCFLFSSDGESELPDGTLVLFERCGAEELDENDFAVFRLARGIGTGRMLRRTEERLIVQAGERLLSVPFAALLGHAVKHYPALGKVLGAFARFDTAGMVLGLFAAASAGISLAVSIARQRLPQAEAYVRERRDAGGGDAP